VDYSVIPRTTFVDPEVATVGLNETAARETGVAFEITQFPLDELDRAIVDGNTRGFVKILTVPGRDRILGVTVVGAHASEMLAEFTLAMRHGLGLKRILGTVHAYPTYAEAARYAAGVWRRAHAPTSFLGLLARYHAWRRG
jgi:pyruvate/2-oxoglutarate dehydrogenase complex dihydrolipoamide dehydrogenase (E3) component